MMNAADHPAATAATPAPPGADRSFEALVNKFYQPLYRFAWGLSRDAIQAADLTQQTFYLWALRGSQLRDREKVRGWLYTTLYREFLREVRRTAHFSEVEFDETLPGLTPNEPGGAVAADGRVARRTLQMVNEPFRTPLRLFYLEDHSYEEIARALGVPLGTVMSRLSRGRTELRARFHRGGNLPDRAAPRTARPACA